VRWSRHRDGTDVGGTLHIVTANGPPRTPTALPAESDNQGVSTFLHTAKGAPADVLIEKADELHADLLVVGTRE